MPEEAKRLLSEVHADAPKVIRAINGLITSQRLTRKILVGVIVVVLFVGVAVWRMAAWAVCTTDRSVALSGPAASRVTYLLDAFTDSGRIPPVKLTHAQRAATIAELAREHERNSLVPGRAKLATLPNSQLVGYVDLVNAFRANEAYRMAAKHHPVCALWGF